MKSVCWLAPLAASAIACASAAKPAPPPETAPAPAAVAIAPPPPPPPAPMPIERYQEGLVRAFLRSNPSRRVGLAPQGGDPPHSVQVLERVGRDRMVITLTAGFGRSRRPFDGLDADNRRVELFALSEGSGAGIGAVLSAIGKALFEPDGPGRAWHMYESIALEAPVSGLQFFDLRPGGELEVEPGAIVTLYKVVPLSQVEFDATKEKRGDQWVGDDEADPGSAARSLKRWSPAIAEP